MKVLAINGSPRRKANTATLLEHALQGAASTGAETRLVHLYAHDHKGCMSCFECKRKGGPSYGKCAVRDGLAPLLEEVLTADGLVLGSPIYFHAESGEMRSFIERLLFPYLTYTPGYASIIPKKIRTAMIYTMNVPEAAMAGLTQDRSVLAQQSAMKRVFGDCELLLSTDTYQFNDYSKYESSVWDEAAKRRRREAVFPVECGKAFELGVRMAGGHS